MIEGLNETSAAISTSTDEDDDFFTSFLAAKVPTSEIAPDSVVLCPMFRIAEDVMNSTSLASGATMNVKLLGPPFPRMCFASCLAGVECQPCLPGERLKFPPVTQKFVLDAIDTLEPLSLVDPSTINGSTKLLCRRQLEEGGELPGTTLSDGGTSTTYILTLNGRKFAARKKTDVSTRERDMATCFLG
jgi:hypothetical protein